MAPVKCTCPRRRNGSRSYSISCGVHGAAHGRWIRRQIERLDRMLYVDRIIELLCFSEPIGFPEDRWITREQAERSKQFIREYRARIEV